MKRDQIVVQNSDVGDFESNWTVDHEVSKTQRLGCRTAIEGLHLRRPITVHIGDPIYDLSARSMTSFRCLVAQSITMDALSVHARRRSVVPMIEMARLPFTRSSHIVARARHLFSYSELYCTARQTSG